jgi:hypothetical protein
MKTYLDVSYEGPPDYAFDTQLEEACGRKATASGYCFPTAKRDLQFTYEDRNGALRAQEELRKLGRGLNISTTPA